MTRTRAMLALPAALAAVLLAGCADGAPEPSPSPSPTTPSPSAPPEPEPATRTELSVDCLSVLAPEIVEDIVAAAPFDLVGYDARIGSSPFASVDPSAVAPIRSTDCALVSADGLVAVDIGYSEFDPAGTETRLAELAAFGDEGEVHQPPGTDLALTDVPGIPEAQQLQIPFADGSTKTWVVGSGWEVYVDVPWTATNVAAPMPNAVTGTLASVAPVTEHCEAMLPVPTEGTDLAWQHSLSSGVTTVSDGATICHAAEASGYERVLWWEEVTATDREQLLDDAAAGVDGMRLQGSTTDGTGAIVALADGTRVVVFDAHLVHVDVPIDGELALQLARSVHAPAWLPVPPVA